jgi:uncharacterized protein YqkB
VIGLHWLHYHGIAGASAGRTLRLNSIRDRLFHLNLSGLNWRLFHLKGCACWVGIAKQIALGLPSQVHRWLSPWYFRTAARYFFQDCWQTRLRTNANMIELRCSIALIVSGSDLNFRTSSPGRENGFVRLQIVSWPRAHETGSRGRDRYPGRSEVSPPVPHRRALLRRL